MTTTNFPHRLPHVFLPRPRTRGRLCFNVDAEERCDILIAPPVPQGVLRCGLPPEPESRGLTGIIASWLDAMMRAV